MVLGTRYQAGMECNRQQAWQLPIPSLGSPVELEFFHAIGR